MSTGSEPGGASVRRDNGLVPDRWSALAALDPAVADGVLAALAQHGVAGLVESRGRGGAGPAAGASGAPAAGPDLLWVDAGLRTEAEALLVAEFSGLVTLLPADPADPADLGQPGAGPSDESRPGSGGVPGSPGSPGSLGGPGAPGSPGGPGGPDVPTDTAGARAARDAPLDEDAAWAQIVAAWDREDAPGPVPPWPVDEDVAGPDRRGGPGGPRPVRPADPSPPVDAPPATGPRDHVRADPADDHYVPPPPPPLPRLRRNTVAALAVLALGIVLLFAPGLIGLGGGDGVALTGIVCIVGSVVALVHGMRDRRAGGNGWDDGAVV